MKKTLVAALLWALAAPAWAQRRHTVVTGDTLWDLAKHYYSDAWKWPKIAAANPAPNIHDPHWIYPGQVIKVAGHGAPGLNGGPNGDLYITFLIAAHPEFKRDGSNLYANVDLDLYTAVLGGEILINTFDGKVKLKVPPETQNGTKVKLKGKGFPVYKKENQFGDLYITYQLKLPTSLSEKEKELFTELSKIKRDGNE